MKLQESGEMYLETIYILLKEKPLVRSIDIAAKMNYSKPSISRAMGLLSDNGYISIMDNGGIVLTEEGLRIARKTYDRHETLTKCFVTAGVSMEIAEEDACRIEHVISDETFEALKKYILK